LIDRIYCGKKVLMIAAREKLTSRVHRIAHPDLQQS